MPASIERDKQAREQHKKMMLRHGEMKGDHGALEYLQTTPEHEGEMAKVSRRHARRRHKALSEEDLDEMYGKESRE